MSGTVANGTVAGGAPQPPLLQVRGLTTSFPAEDGRTAVVSEVGFTVNPGAITGIVGESGSGKSISIKSVLGLVRSPGRVEAGAAWFNSSRGRIDLVSCTPRQRREVLGTDIGYVIQNPFGALNPVVRIGKQFRTVLSASANFVGRSRGALDEIAHQTLAQVGITDPARVLNGYAHQLSGGMAQRVVIAFALARKPKLIVADEPTTALDLTVQRQILDLMAQRAAELGASMLIVTHDLGVVAQYCQDAFVFYRGRMIEHGPVDHIFHRTKQDYTRSLIAASGGREATAELTREAV
jgi:ABC-type dipeptide/oligopeptide/nickel transport system ATPase component